MLCSFVTSSDHVVRFLETKEPKIQDCGNSAKILNKLLKKSALAAAVFPTTASNSRFFLTQFFQYFLTLPFPMSLLTLNHSQPDLSGNPFYATQWSEKIDFVEHSMLYSKIFRFIFLIILQNPVDICF